MPQNIKELIERRKKWLEEIETQDNRCTAKPIIVALQTAREYPARDNYPSDGEWPPNEDHGTTESVPFKIHWEDEQHFFTYSALQDHLRLNRHNYPKTRDFVKYAFRNREWAEIPIDFKAMIDHIEYLEKELHELRKSSDSDGSDRSASRAEQITAISRGMQQLRKGRLNDRAITTLLHDITRLSKTDIKRVLDGLEELEKTFLKKSSK